VDVPFVVRQRLEELGLGQRDLARAARVTESYISQLLTRRKAPPAPNRTDIYDRMDKFLRLPNGELARLAALQRKEELKRELGDEATPLFREVRDLVLRKCQPDKAKHIRAIFETQAFGELERLVTLKLLDAAKEVARQELHNKSWLRTVLGGRSYEEMRVVVLEFLDTDLFRVSAENCVSFLNPLIESWDIDLATFRLDIALSQRVAAGRVKRFEYVEREPEPPGGDGVGLKKFLQDAALSGTATEAELAFLRRLRCNGRQPTALYYYRELQNLRDPLHFRAAKKSQ
jgi:transcriptional regulator with XRE-family HTH domain